MGLVVRDMGLVVRDMGLAAGLCSPAPGLVPRAAYTSCFLFVNDRLQNLFDFSGLCFFPKKNR